MFGTIRRMPFGHLTWDSKVTDSDNLKFIMNNTIN